MRNFLLGIIFTLVVLFAGGYFYAAQGYVNFRADQEPSSAERHFALAAVKASTDRHASVAKKPAPATGENLIAAGVTESRPIPTVSSLDPSIRPHPAF
jgi:hypothetical protein